MPSDWSRSWEVDRLVAGHLSFEGDVALADLPRLKDRMMPGHAVREVAHASLHFGNELDTDVARVTVAATVPLRCERCMGRVDWPVAAQATLGLIGSLADADRVPGGIEPVLAEAGRVQLRELVEEELLLALPLVARHENAAECLDSEADAADDEVVTQKPFAGLAELLKRR